MTHIVGGKYRVMDLLGEGGMGAVYNAVRVGTGERVALKLVSHKHTDETSLARFEREARLASQVSSEHVVQIYDTGTDEETGLPYIAMELLDGEELEHVLDAVGTLPVDVALSIAAQALSGLAKAHEAGIVHRDIKLSNIFMQRVGGGQRAVKLLDFGIAKQGRQGVLDEETKGLTRTGTMLGSPLYMSPEQARGHKTVDERSDVWAMGVVLYRMLTGVVPNDDVDMFGELILRITTVPVPPVQSLAPWVDPQVADLVERALEIEKEGRFANAQEMLEAVVAIIGADWAISDDDLEPISVEIKSVVAEPSRRRVADEASFADTRADAPAAPTQPNGDTYSAVTGATPPRPASRARLYLALAVVLGGGLTLAAMVMRSERPEALARMDAVFAIDHARAIDAATARQAVTSEPAANLAPTIRLTIDAKPQAVDVYLDGAKIGTTADKLAIARGEREIVLVLKKPGYRDTEVRLVPAADILVSASLVPLGKAPLGKAGRPPGHPDLESPL